MALFLGRFPAADGSAAGIEPIALENRSLDPAAHHIALLGRGHVVAGEHIAKQELLRTGAMVHVDAREASAPTHDFHRRASRRFKIGRASCRERLWQYV